MVGKDSLFFGEKWQFFFNFAQRYGLLRAENKICFLIRKKTSDHPNLKKMLKSYILPTILCSLFVIAACQETTKPKPQPSPADKYDLFTPAEFKMLQPGDIILRKGNGMVSNFIASFLEEKYPITHCGILTKRADNKFYVISCESTPEVDGMICNSLGEFCQSSLPHSTAVVRPKGSDEQRRRVLAEAEWYMKQTKPFDMKFDITDSTEYYCVELFMHIFEHVYNKNYFPRRKKLITFDVIHMDNFLDTTNFQILFNHAENK